MRKKYFISRIIIIIIVSELVTAFMLFPFSIVHSCIPMGPIEWVKTWGGDNQEIMFEMVVDSSEDIFIAGEIWSYDETFNDIFIVKINETFSFNATWGDVMQQEFSGMVLDSEENIFITGSSTGYLPGIKEVFLLKYNNNLTLEWSTTWDVIGLDFSAGIVVDSLDNIYISGMTNYPNCDVFLIKYNNSGAIQWNYTWSTESNNTSEEVLSMVVDSMDNIFLGVNTNTTGSEWFLLKYNSSGSLLLNRSYNKFIPIEQLVIDSSDDLYALGSYNSTYLTKLNNEGNVEWNLTCIQNVLRGTEKLVIDSSDNVFVIGNELINLSAIVHGYNMTDYDTYLMKFNETGDLYWNHTISYSNNIYPELLTFDPLGNIYFGGSLGMIAPGGLGYSIIILDNLGYCIRSESGGCTKGNCYCKGIYAESPINFIAAINSPCCGEDYYDIMLIKYTKFDISHCLPVPNPWLIGILQIGISTILVIIGISYLVKKEKRRKVQRSLFKII
ncbi:MAG: hypothetical protein ACFE88_15195 [Candidatus Hermodarchaeota archaeon]